MVEHNMSVVADLSDTITVLARAKCWRKGLRHGVEESAGRRSYVGTVMR